MAAALAALAVLAAARAALALHTAVHSEPIRSEPVRSEPNQDATQVGNASAEANRHWLISDDEITPSAVQADLDNRRMGLERHEQDDAEPVAIDAHRKHLKTEQSLWLHGKSRQAMTNYNDVQYVSFLEVGGQIISGILDTGSFELMVFSTVCETCGQASKYDPSLSANHTRGKLATVEQYGSGDLFVQEAWDMVSIGPFPPKYQAFWEVTNGKMQVLQYSAFQSIIGIGPPETPVSDAEDLVQTAIENISNYTAAGVPVPDDLTKDLDYKKQVVEA